MEQTKLYVGCGLTGAPQHFTEEVESLKRSLANDFEVFDFIGLEKGTSADVYNWDIGHCVADCDVLVGICDYPSLGLGWEMSKAVGMGTPTLAVAHTTSRVTRLVLGAAEVEPVMSFERYENMLADIPRLIMAKVAEIG